MKRKSQIGCEFKTLPFKLMEFAANRQGRKVSKISISGAAVEIQE